MRTVIMIIILVCACTNAQAQTNFVQNPSFERYDTCPYKSAQIYLATYWQNPVVPVFRCGSEYYNTCAVGNFYAGCPENGEFYQNPHSGNGMAGATFYYDKTSPSPPPPCPFNQRSYVQGHLFSRLIVGKIYCVSFWVNFAETSGYGNNKIGAYLDDGSINSAVDSGGEEITSVIPQVYTDSVIIDTANWVKIEGSFIAKGNETYITIGNFATNAMTKTIVTDYYHVFSQQSGYLIDDVSVIPIDLDVQAGADTWVEVSKTVQIGRVGDSTAVGLDCKWYHKGSLIDSGAIITVKAAATKGVIDTYVVVQTICGNVKTDTVLVTTVPLGLQNISLPNTFTVYPNPSDGNITITSLRGGTTKQSATVYDLLGRTIQRQQLTFSNNQSNLKIDAPAGTYILELRDEAGNNYRERIIIHK